MAHLSQGCDIEEGSKLAEQRSVGNNNGTNPDVSGQIQRGQLTFFHDTKVGKGLLKIAYLIPIAWCVVKIVADPLFLYAYVIDEEKKCFALDDGTRTFSKFIDVWSIIVNVLNLYFLLGNLNLLQRRFEKTIWFVLILIDLLSHIEPHLPKTKALLLVMSGLWPFAGGLNFYSANAYLLQYFGTIFMLHKMTTRVRRISATLAKAASTKAAFYLVLYIAGPHVVGALWYAFAIMKKMDCWMKACAEYSSSNCDWAGLSCGVNNGIKNYTMLNQMCPPRAQNTTFYDFGIYLGAVESGIIEVSSLHKRIANTLRWGVQNLSDLGQNLRPSTDTWENIFVMSFSIWGMVLFAFFIGIMQMRMLYKYQKSEDTRNRQREIENSKFFTKLSKKLRRLVMRWPNEWVESKDDHFQNLFDNASENIERDMKRELCLKIIKKVEELSWSDELLDELCDQVIPVSYPRYTRIQMQNRSIKKMLFIVCGKLQTCSSDWSIDYLEAEMFCGEELVHQFQVDPYSGNLPISTRTIKTMTKVDAFVLEADDLQKLFIKHRVACASTQEQAPRKPENFGRDDDEADGDRELTREAEELDRLEGEEQYDDVPDLRDKSEDTAPGPSHPRERQTDSHTMELLKRCVELQDTLNKMPSMMESMERRLKRVEAGLELQETLNKMRSTMENMERRLKKVETRLKLCGPT